MQQAESQEFKDRYLRIRDGTLPAGGPRSFAQAHGKYDMANGLIILSIPYG